jgi:hypothetical protein
VRSLLESTELVDIAKTAKIVVEIVKEQQEQKVSSLVSKKVEFA